jgi:hypothetical protein
MTVGRLQAILSILVVGTFLLVSAAIALTPVVGGYPPGEYSEHLKTFASLYSGIIGIVIGFYFGKRSPGDRKD